MSSPLPPVRPWPCSQSRRGPDLKLFQVRHDTLQNPKKGSAFQALVLETPDWANVVALNAAHELVLVRQFRFGRRSITTEIPGGMVDSGEEPLQAARRELLEETGYTSDQWTHLGSVEPNPAFHDNLCHHFLALNASQTAAQNLDPNEDVRVVTLPVSRVIEMIRVGEMQNAMVVTALSKVFDLRVMNPDIA